MQRSGREGITLRNDIRKTVWYDWFQPYQRGLTARGAHDFNDLIALAVDELRARPLSDEDSFGLVVVDEVQDFTLRQLQLVYEIAGAREDSQLLLVGDSQQRVYVGGCTLAEAGIPVPGGRGRILRTNYRNRAAVLSYVQRIETPDSVDDLDGGTGAVIRDSTPTLPDGDVVEARLTRRESLTALPQAIRDANLAADADIAVIVSTRSDIDRYLTALRKAGLRAMPLEHYDGTQPSDIKVGTVHRAKGMDFTAVFLLLTPPPPTRPARDAEALRTRQHLVAASRARDYLWVCTLTD